MNVVVVGCGYVGSELAARLARGGHRVHGLRRSEAALPEGVLPLRADVTDAESLRAILPEDTTHVAYCVGAASSEPAAYRAAYVDGVRAVLASLGGRARVVFTSSTAVLAEDAGGDVDERSPVHTTGNPGILLEGEQRVRDAGGVVIRLAGIYGRGRDRIVRMVRDGSARCTQPPPIGNRIHQRDCAGAVAHLLAHPSPEPVYLGVDDAPVELCEVYRWIAERLGVAPPPASDEPDARGRGARKRCRNALLRASGWAPEVPTYRDGYAPLIEALRG